MAVRTAGAFEIGCVAAPWRARVLRSSGCVLCPIKVDGVGVARGTVAGAWVAVLPCVSGGERNVAVVTETETESAAAIAPADGMKLRVGCPDIDTPCSLEDQAFRHCTA